eukprot:GHVH01011603.1.p1 GENE.GHVH01011603.1~~GHVH01011603.1.p1  ORF type:complete len:238 (-),score=31.19 GHVH01011603.1:42-755(-)
MNGSQTVARPSDLVSDLAVLESLGVIVEEGTRDMCDAWHEFISACYCAWLVLGAGSQSPTMKVLVSTGFGTSNLKGYHLSVLTDVLQACIRTVDLLHRSLEPLLLDYIDRVSLREEADLQADVDEVGSNALDNVQQLKESFLGVYTKVENLISDARGYPIESEWTQAIIHDIISHAFQISDERHLDPRTYATTKSETVKKWSIESISVRDQIGSIVHLVETYKSVQSWLKREVCRTN